MREEMKKSVFLRFRGASIKKTRLSRLSCKRVDVIGDGWTEFRGTEGGCNGIGDMAGEGGGGPIVEDNVPLPLPIFNKVSKQEILSGI